MFARRHPIIDSCWTACNGALVCGVFFVLVSAVLAADNANESEAPRKQETTTPAKMASVTLAGAKVTLQLPESWKSVQPRSRIIEREFAVPFQDSQDTQSEDLPDGRLTMMRSGGSIALNVERWMNQFQQPDGKATKDVAKITKKTVHDQEVVIVHITGTFTETMGGGPFAPGKTVTRPDYQMLGGIVQTKSSGQYFFKLYGPQKTIAAAEKQFTAMIESVQSEAQK